MGVGGQSLEAVLPPTSNPLLPAKKQAERRTGKGERGVHWHGVQVVVEAHRGRESYQGGRQRPTCGKLTGSF